MSLYLHFHAGGLADAEEGARCHFFLAVVACGEVLTGDRAVPLRVSVYGFACGIASCFP